MLITLARLFWGFTQNLVQFATRLCCLVGDHNYKFGLSGRCLYCDKYLPSVKKRIKVLDELGDESQKLGLYNKEEGE